MRSYTYRVIVEPDEGDTFHAYVPALAGCHTWGETFDQTRINIRDAIDVYIRSLKADGEPIPEDSKDCSRAASGERYSERNASCNASRYPADAYRVCKNTS